MNFIFTIIDFVDSKLTTRFNHFLEVDLSKDFDSSRTIFGAPNIFTFMLNYKEGYYQNK